MYFVKLDRLFGVALLSALLAFETTGCTMPESAGKSASRSLASTARVTSSLEATPLLSQLAAPVDTTMMQTTVRNLFLKMLGRQPTQGELDDYVALMVGGKTASDIEHAIGVSDSYYALVITNFYQASVGHDPDAAGMNYYMSMLKSGGWTFSQVANAILSSPEAIAYTASKTAPVGSQTDRNLISIRSLSTAYFGQASLDNDAVRNQLVFLEQGGTLAQIERDFSTIKNIIYDVTGRLPGSYNYAYVESGMNFFIVNHATDAEHRVAVVDAHNRGYL